MHAIAIVFTLLLHFININGYMPEYCEKVWETSNIVNNKKIYGMGMFMCTEPLENQLNDNIFYGLPLFGK